MAKKKILEEVEFSMVKGVGGSLFGIANYMKDYQVAYYLNKTLGIELERESDFEFWRKKQNEPEFYPFYTYTDSFNHLMYLFLSTKSCSGENLLHKNLKGLDKLLFIFGRDHLEMGDFFTKNYRSIPNTLLIKHFEFATLENDSEKEESAKIQKEKKFLSGLFDFLEEEFLPEVEMNLMLMEKENDKINIM